MCEEPQYFLFWILTVQWNALVSIPNRNDKLCLQGEDADEDDAYQVLSTLKRITAFHKYDECGDFIT